MENIKLSKEEQKQRELKIIEKPKNLLWKNEIIKKNPKVKRINGFPEEILNNLDKYPSKKGLPLNHKIINVKIFEDGSGNIEGIIKDGKEKTNTYSAFSASIPSDRELFNIEKQQFKRGVLKDISERTLKFHNKETYWENLNSEIKSNKIKKGNH